MSAQTVAIQKVFTCLFLSGLLMLMQVQTSRAEGISKEFRSDIMKLLKMTGAEAIGLQMSAAVSNQMIDSLLKEDPEIPPKAVAAIKEEINQTYADEMPKLIAEIVPIYARHYTHEEIKGLIAFYSTPLGEKSIKEMPALLNECMQAGREWGQQLTPRILPRLESRLKREVLDQ